MRAANPSGSGDRNGRWKGGRRTTRGYVYLYRPDHPNVTTNGGMAEHVLVMEEVLGRYLLPGENVHHKNGQRDDNRPSNLELWVKAQPAGQRAVDLLAWAREIEARYGPAEAVLAPS